MHMIIRAIVYADSEETALEKAERVFQGLIDSQDFDYFQMFNNEGTSVSGRGRWGDVVAVALANSKEGKELIEDGMKYTEENFSRALEAIKEQIDRPRTELEADMGDFRYWCYVAGAYSGSSVFLYDNDGLGIRDRATLERVLATWGSEEYKDLDVYVVTADVHH